MLEMYLATREVPRTARHLAVTTTTITKVMYQAVRSLRKIAGIKPCGLPSDPIGFDDDERDH